MSDLKRSLLTPDQIDNLGFALIALTKELWVVKDRQLITEALLKEKGVLADLDAYQPMKRSRPSSPSSGIGFWAT